MKVWNIIVKDGIDTEINVYSVKELAQKAFQCKLEAFFWRFDGGHSSADTTPVDARGMTAEEAFKHGAALFSGSNVVRVVESELNPGMGEDNDIVWRHVKTKKNIRDYVEAAFQSYAFDGSDITIEDIDLNSIIELMNEYDGGYLDEVEDAGEKIFQSCFEKWIKENRPEIAKKYF